MNNKEFIASLASRTGYSQDTTQKMVKTVIEVMATNFEAGDPVQITGFGSFEVKKRLERVMKNPSTGNTMLIPPKLVLNFKPTLSVKAQFKKGGTE